MRTLRAVIHERLRNTPAAHAHCLPDVDIDVQCFHELDGLAAMQLDNIQPQFSHSPQDQVERLIDKHSHTQETGGSGINRPGLRERLRTS